MPFFIALIIIIYFPFQIRVAWKSVYICSSDEYQKKFGATCSACRRNNSMSRAASRVDGNHMSFGAKAEGLQTEPHTQVYGLRI